MNTLSYRRSLWIHQYDQLHEATIGEVCATALSYASADCVLKKVYDGVSLMGPGIDHDVLAIDSLATWRAQQAQAAAAGVTLVGWVNATHHDQAALHAGVGETVVVDLEPYGQFWADGPGDVGTYLAGLRAGGVKQVLVSIDPRPAALVALGVRGWVNQVDALLPQLYWTDFGQAETVIPALVDQLVTYGVELLPVLPWDGAAADLAAAWSYAAGKGATGVSLWRMGTAGPEVLRAFGSLGLPARPVVVDEVAALRQALSAAQGKLAAIARVLAS